ncbi:MAG: hypothetical protein LCH84_06195 [Gemmatimonadetes bacterium]|nr:hypothetical protein [Gemmatimonadota bacterium]
MHWQSYAGVVAILAATPVVVPGRAHAQPTDSTARVQLGAMAVALGTTSAPAVAGRRLTEGYLSQPNLLGAATLWQRPRVAVRAVGTLNAEGYTLRRGELTAGSYGEGYVDRRHPHTLVHEAMLTVRAMPSPEAGWRASLAAGKGFVPYGTDDPMMRPFVKYPVNHHHAQLLERVQGVAALQVGTRARGATLEQAWFNGDEPVAPFTGPQWRRVGDSHATRLTLHGARALEAQLSHAFVRSPGITQGGAFDHRQLSASVRWQPSDAAHDHASPTSRDAEHGADHDANRDTRPRDASPRLTYLLAEVARTDEGANGARAFRYESALIEATGAWRRWQLAARVERTDRPEPTRLLDVFRTTTGHIDFQIVGITRWTTGTLHLDAPPRTLLRTAVVPFVEATRASAVARQRPAVFEPAAFYGSARQWSLSAGLRLHVGRMRARMGRYGVLDSAL